METWNQMPYKNKHLALLLQKILKRLYDYTFNWKITISQNKCDDETEASDTKCLRLFAYHNLTGK